MPNHRFNVISIAAIAFMIADIAHECIGHGIGFLLAGGHHGIFTTTRLITTEHLGDRSDLFDIGGPLGNLLCAALAWLALRHLPTSRTNLRLLSALALAFSLFWAFSYLAYSSAKAQGDWVVLFYRLPHQVLWRIAYFVIGLFLYRESIRLTAAKFPWTRELLVTAYLTGGSISVLGALLDPRGLPAILHDGLLSGFGAALGLLFVPTSCQPAVPVQRSPAWILTAATLALFYIFILGRGISFTL